MCFGDRVPNGEGNVTGRQTGCFPFSCPVWAGLCCAISQEQQQELSTPENERLILTPVTWGCRGWGTQHPWGHCLQQADSSKISKARVGYHASMQTSSRSPGTMATFFSRWETGNWNSYLAQHGWR